MTTNSLASAVHHGLINDLLETGTTGDTEKLARTLSVSAIDVEAAYRWLHENHGLVLQPDYCAALTSRSGRRRTTDEFVELIGAK